MKKYRIMSVVFAVLAAGIMFFIFWNSSKNGQESAQMSSRVMDILKPIFDPKGVIADETFHTIVRKLAHFSEFAALSAMLTALALCLKKLSGRSFVGAELFACLFTAVTDEFIQSFTGRTSSVRDVLIDFSGALLATVILLVAAAIIEKPKRKKKS